mmetsp:Transcript_35002/g.46236  ORF Transcript_35002/g.46236 Transcript_35002/m.46236 type:complete len:274 (-) Transcript_35002:385-1206(-)
MSAFNKYLLAVVLLFSLSLVQSFSPGLRMECKSKATTTVPSKPTKNNKNNISATLKRSDFVSSCISSTILLATVNSALAADFKSYISKIKGPSGNPALVSFKYPRKWTLSETPGLIAKNEETKDNIYFETFSNPDKSFEELSPTAILDKIFDSRGRYSQFGKPDDYRSASSKLEEIGGNTYRYIDVRFTALSPTQRTVERRGVVYATQVGDDVFLLFGSSTTIKWKKDGEEIKESVLSFRASETTDKGKGLSQQKKTDLEKLDQIRAQKEFQF